MILAMIAGSASGILIFSLMDVGLVAGPSPGSIFSYLALTPKGDYLGVILGVAIATAVSFIIASLILKVSKNNNDDSLEESAKKSKEMKEQGKRILSKTIEADETSEIDKKIEYKHIAFACDAGLGSSALGATMFNKKLNAVGVDIKVKNYAIEKVPSDVDVIVVHSDLKERTIKANPNKQIITIENYLNDGNIELLLTDIVGGE